MKIVIIEHKHKDGFQSRFSAAENIKAAAQKTGIGESTLKKNLYGKLRIYENQVYRIHQLEIIGMKRKERADKQKRVEQMKRINLQRTAEKIKQYGKIEMTPESKKKFTEEVLQGKELREAPQPIQQKTQSNGGYNSNTFAKYQQARIECDTEEDWMKLQDQIRNDSSLTFKQKAFLTK